MRVACLSTRTWRPPFSYIFRCWRSVVGREGSMDTTVFELSLHRALGGYPLRPLAVVACAGVGSSDALRQPPIACSTSGMELLSFRCRRCRTMLSTSVCYESRPVANVGWRPSRWVRVAPPCVSATRRLDRLDTISMGVTAPFFVVSPTSSSAASVWGNGR